MSLYMFFFAVRRSLSQLTRAIWGNAITVWRTSTAGSPKEANLSSNSSVLPSSVVSRVKLLLNFCKRFRCLILTHRSSKSIIKELLQNAVTVNLYNISKSAGLFWLIERIWLAPISPLVDIWSVPRPLNISSLEFLATYSTATQIHVGYRVPLLFKRFLFRLYASYDHWIARLRLTSPSSIVIYFLVGVKRPESPRCSILCLG